MALDATIRGLIRTIGIVCKLNDYTALIQYLLGAILIYGLNPPFDKNGFRL
jgi:hypothetical protein